MIYGEFNTQGELIFEIGLIAADGDIIPVQALLDTGFTGWLAIDNQDALSLGWLVDINPSRMQTARGEARFNLYQGSVLLDEQEFAIPALGGDELQDILLGVRWLQTKRLVADFPGGVLTLG
ncbi:aspartyl protease [Hassallia byssoidea VB512170]|uniref:Aspartyl protease n=1 Tax=Hassallia byssoidea VB512170 TaxID=1304833 RepID=A0A846HGT2_9CYAN|nr:aspartyl protease [Hassalia byssoidea]NEU75601.1 aspartyl protease [Hassalia byssoidea VB512170]